MRIGSIVTVPARGIRAMSAMIFRRNPMRVWAMPRSKYDYMSEVGDGTRSSTVMAPLLWIARSFPEAPPMLWRKQDDGLEMPDRAHAMLRLLERPNQHHSGANMWMATLIDYYVDGNAFWLKIRDRGGIVRELWWTPHWMLHPKGDDKTFITHYEYRPDGQTVLLPPSSVVHFRHGLDGDNPRKGYSPLKSVLREVFTDDEAANFTASLLRNMGIPGLIVSPDGETPPTEQDVQDTKAYIRENFGGDKRGEALVMSGPTKVQQFGFSPEQLLLKELRRIPEERVTAVIGVPAVVAGLGAGLDRSTFTNYGEARQAAWEQTLVPVGRSLAEEVRAQLLSDYEADTFGWRFGFDLANVRALQEDRDKLLRRTDVAVRGGWMTVGFAKKLNGFPVDDANDNIYLRDANKVQVPADGGQPRPLAPTTQETPSPVKAEPPKVDVSVTLPAITVEGANHEIKMEAPEPPEPPVVNVNVEPQGAAAPVVNVTVEKPGPTQKTIDFGDGTPPIT